MTDDKKIELLIDAIQLFIVIIGVIWAYFRIWKEGVHKPRIQFEIECQSFAHFNNEVPIEFRLILKNKGIIKHKFHSIMLRVRGIRQDNELSLWKENEPRLLFPEKLIDAQVIYKKKYNHVFVEPGVDQVLNYVVKLPCTYKIISARAEFEYDVCKNHSIEKIFELKTTHNNIGS